ncbi:MAG: hypothetical protein WC861_06735 [Candidatus Micrarchaeia archaeon]|jgi:hypothetical protein
MERTIAASVRVPMRERRNGFFDKYPMKEVKITLKGLERETGLSPKLLSDYVYCAARLGDGKKNSHRNYSSKASEVERLVAKREGIDVDDLSAWKNAAETRGADYYWQRSAAYDDIWSSSHGIEQKANENYKPSHGFIAGVSAALFTLWTIGCVLILNPIKDTKSFAVGVAIGLIGAVKIYMKLAIEDNDGKSRNEYEKAIVQLAFNLRAAVIDMADAWTEQRRNEERK